jgi:hypothetical protein
MPELHEVSYSREATIAAFRDFYQFLTKMYLPENMVEEPPAGGWPTITNENVRLLGKNDEVAELMRHLPYISDHSLLAPHAEIAHWPALLTRHPKAKKPFDATAVDDVRILAEGLEWENVPPSAFGISIGHDTFILDTRFGIVHCLETPIEVKDTASREAITDEFGDCTPENEHGWRCCGAAWAIDDFFEVLKERYRELLYLPVHETRIEEWFDEYEEDDDDDDDYRPVLSCIRQVYKDHDWPDLSAYTKKECLDSVDKLIEERFPDGRF